MVALMESERHICSIGLCAEYQHVMVLNVFRVSLAIIQNLAAFTEFGYIGLASLELSYQF